MDVLLALLVFVAIIFQMYLVCKPRYVVYIVKRQEPISVEDIVNELEESSDSDIKKLYDDVRQLVYRGWPGYERLHGTR